MTYKLFLNDHDYYIINENNSLRTDRSSNLRIVIRRFTESDNLSKVTGSTSHFHPTGGITLITTFSSIEDLYEHYPELFI